MCSHEFDKTPNLKRKVLAFVFEFVPQEESLVKSESFHYKLILFGCLFCYSPCLDLQIILIPEMTRP